jgi:RNA polymerase sigma-70 factor, ECF subfamily
MGHPAGILASCLPTFVLPKKFMNKTMERAVFITEDRRVVAGEAILSGATEDRTRGDRDEAGKSTAENCLEKTGEIVERLVREHARLAYRITYAVLRRHHDAEDAVQETFVRVLRYQTKLSIVEDPKTWLARIAWRVAVDRARKLAGEREVALDDPEKPVAEPSSNDVSADDQLQSVKVGATLEKLIATLPAKLREPLILSAMEEMSPREVAATLDISEAAVRSRVFRARQILKEKMEQWTVRK